MRFQWVLQGITCFEDTRNMLYKVFVGESETEDIVYWRYRFTGGEGESKDTTKCILAIFR